MARQLDISNGLYSMLERGVRRMNDTYLEGIATILGVRPSALIADDEGAGQFVDMYLKLDPGKREEAVRFLRFLGDAAPLGGEVQPPEAVAAKQGKGRARSGKSAS